MFEKKEVPIYFRIKLEELLDAKTQEKINTLADKIYEETKIEWFGEDYGYYIDVKTLSSKGTTDPETGDIVFEIKAEINPKKENCEELLEVMNRLVVGL